MSAGRSKDKIIVRAIGSEDVELEDKTAMRIGGPADDIIVRIGGLEGDTAVRDGGPGMAFARGHSSFAPSKSTTTAPMWPSPRDSRATPLSPCTFRAIWF